MLLSWVPRYGRTYSPLGTAVTIQTTQRTIEIIVERSGDPNDKPASENVDIPGGVAIVTIFHCIEVRDIFNIRLLSGSTFKIIEPHA